MDLGLENRRALVVGGSAGIGFETALLMAEDQADVMLAARNSETLADATRRISKQTGVSVGSFTIDATSTTAEIELSERYAGRALDMLVVTIGGSVRGEFSIHSDETWRDNYTTNVLAPVRVIRALMPALSRGDQPAVTVLGAASSKMPYQHQIVSNVHKTGLLALVKTLALELAPTVRVNAVCPGRTLTRLWLNRADQMAEDEDRTPEEVLRDFSEEIPLGRMAKPAEVAAAVVFITSPRASYITGQHLTVDGGIARGLL